MEIARAQGITGLKFAAVTGDDVFSQLEQYSDAPILEFDGTVGQWTERLVSANAYMGAEGIIQALKDGADVVITAGWPTPPLTLAPLRYEYGWTIDDAGPIGQCVLAGHLLECGGQVTRRLLRRPGL